jgi:hypothetical protein
MPDPDRERRQFYRRFDKPGESICLARFHTVKAYRSEKLDHAENDHRRSCPNDMKLRINLPLEHNFRASRPPISFQSVRLVADTHPGA